MASKDPEEHFNTGTDEETVALRKKRLRRVSFADREITSVHIFNRDEDYETPPEDSSRKPSSEEEEREVLSFFRDLAADSDDFKEMSPGDNDEVVSRKSFFQPNESPSPGSSLIGSATSNDEDNFFGPVSASFIRHGRLSDSAASDDNHDITMDSTAFSMHFRSLVRSESGDLKTPTGTNFSFEEKTPTQVATSADPGSFMVLTKAKKPNVQSSLAVGKVSGGRDSNDMSLVGDDRHRYDYARLSPALESLLAESGENMQVDSLFDSASDTKSLKKSEVSIFDDIGPGSLDIKDNRDTDMCNVGPDDVYADGVSIAHSSLSEVNGGSTATFIDQIIHDCPPSRVDDVVADAHASDCIQCPNLPNNVKDTFIEVVTETSMQNIEIPVGSCDNPPDVNGNSVHRLGSYSQHEPADLCSPENLLKGNLPADGTHDSLIAQLPDQNPESPLSGFITLLSAKRKQIFLDTTNSSRHLPYVTPSPRQPGSFSRKENIKVGESMSSTRKSHSKFKIAGSSACTYALRDELEKSKRRLSEYLPSATSPVNNVMEETARNLRFQHVDAAVMNLEKHFFSADRKNEEHTITTHMNGDGSGTPKNCGSLIQNKLVLVNGGESLDHLSNLIPSGYKQTEIIAAAASPAQLTSPGKIQYLLMSNNPTQGTLGVSVSDTSPVEITLDQRKDQQATNDIDIFISPSMKRIDQKLSSLAETHCSRSGNLKQEVQCKSLVLDSRLYGNSVECATSGNHLIGMADKLDSSVAERTVSNSPLIKINLVSDSTQEQRVDDREIYTSAIQKASEMVKKFQILAGDMDLMKFQLTTRDKNLQIANDPSLTKGELPREEIKASPCVPTSPYVQRSVNEPSLLKSPTRKEPTWSPSRKEQGDSSLRNRMHFTRSGLSSKFNSDEHANYDCRQGLDNSLNLSAVQDFDNSSRGKRKSEEIVLGDADNADNINGIQRSLKVHKSGGTDLELMMEQSDGNKKGSEKIGGDKTLRHWTDISPKFSAQTNQILSPSIEKLNDGAIGMLEDILARLQKVYKYETLCSEILSQKTYDWSINVGHSRVAEIRLLLYKIVHVKAMLQVARMKHEKLLKRGLLLDSGIQKFETFKLNYVRHLSAPVKRNPQVDDNLLDSSIVNVESKNEVARDNVTRMRQEVESLDRKTRNLVKSLHTYCKMKEVVSCADTMALLNDNLKKRMCCRTICKDLQLWKIDDLETKNSNQSLVLNYSGFICQRFTRTANPVSSMVISNKVIDINITKNFANMNACVAFAFVFNAESTKKSVGSKSLAQETQTTSSLLQNLLGVVEEVRLAKIENRNLIHASFNSPSAEQLNLQLSFIDFNSGRKVTMTLDVTCLNHGVYPSEIFPYQLEVSAVIMQKSLPEELSSEIKATISNLATGYLRVVRLCRGVSQVVQLSSR